jgi:GntR family transcriptional regulator/MocR family aminotransferase
MWHSSVTGSGVIALSGRSDKTLWSGLFRISVDSGQTLQSQIRQAVVTAILDRQMPANQPLPSCRTLANRLSVARGTVVLAYQQLVDQGFLIALERRGHFVNPEALTDLPEAPELNDNAARADSPDWDSRMPERPSRDANIVKPGDWITFSYPFVYGQFDPSLFPTAEWRECSRMALGVREIRNWASDMIDRDDPLLIEQIQARLLPRRGIFARPEEIMVTLGAQHALFLIATLLMGKGTKAVIEEPGYPDARNIIASRTSNVRLVTVDGAGLDPDAIEADCDYVFTTPSHHCPTTVSMPLDRRKALLNRAVTDDFVLIEDDYDSQLLDDAEPLPALKSLDDAGRVIYIGSLSKTLAPGLRLGYIVADPAVLSELRSLRRMMLRHPPANNQRAVALFLSLGHHDALVRRLTQAFARRRRTLIEALDAHLPMFAMTSGHSGTALWLKGPTGMDAAALSESARQRGVLVERGDVFFAASPKPRNVMRLGISSIAEDKIEPGIEELAKAAAEVLARPLELAG